MVDIEFSANLMAADVVPGPVELGLLGVGLLVSVGVVSAVVWFVVRLVKAKSDKG